MHSEVEVLCLEIHFFNSPVEYGVLHTLETNEGLLLHTLLKYSPEISSSSCVAFC